MSKRKKKYKQPPYYRQFNGLTFAYLGLSFSKKNAQNRIKSLREKGYLVRIVKHDVGFTRSRTGITTRWVIYIH